MRGTYQGDVGGGCRGGGADLISGLSDDLLHSILLRLPDTVEAARTSILCRRWRRVWAYLPEPSFRYQNEPVSAAQARGRVDAALGTHSAATVTRLEITIPDGSPADIPTDSGVSPWLRFASERLAGELELSLPYNSGEQEEEELLLPPCERLTAIRFDLNRTMRFQMPPPTGGGGLFPALSTLRITNARVDGRELERFLSTRCPRLEELALEWITLRDGALVLSIRSDSLRRLDTSGMGFEGQLQVAAPQLRCFFPGSLCGLHVAAPNLSELLWQSPNYDPTRHRFAEAGRHLRRLVTSTNYPAAALMRRFDIVDELDVTVSIAKGSEEYKRYLEDIKKPFQVSGFGGNIHGDKKACGTVHLSYSTEDYPCKSPGCPCGLQEKATNSIALDSLKEIEVKGYDSDHKVELVRLLCRCSSMFGKRMAITVYSQSSYMRAKIVNSIRPRWNNQVELTVCCPRVC